MIEVQNLTKKYGSVTAVDSISFTANPGQVTGFLGPNGAGKTTTMRMLTGFLPPTSGKAIVAGYDVFEQSMEVRKRVGFQVMIFLLVFAGLLYFTKKKVWANAH